MKLASNSLTNSQQSFDNYSDKILNPFISGEEMDFLELLKSFGLNMSSVAAALGIDVAALNKMDQDVLLHLLTSQQSNKS